MIVGILLKCVRSRANGLWYFNALRKQLIREREKIIHARLLVRLWGTQGCTRSGNQWCGDIIETEAVCVWTTPRPCRIQNQEKSEAKVVMKLIFWGWDVLVGFISILLPVCFCPVRCLEQRSSSVQKSKIFTWRNAKKGLFFFFFFKPLTGFGGWL